MSKKDDIESILKIQQEEGKRLSEGLIHRHAAEALRSQINSRLVKVVQGIRRCGKSSLCLEVLKGQRVAYVNFDDERLLGLTAKDLQTVFLALQDISPQATVFFFDEVQNVSGWELFVNRLQRNGVNVFLTGSNGKLLGKDLASHLTGRQISVVLHPFSFSEFKRFKDSLGVRYASEQACFEDYFRLGGFPEVIRGEDQRLYLQELFDKIISRDIIQRFRLREVKLIKELGLYLIQNSSQKASLKSLMGKFRFKSINTVRKYIEYLKDVFLISELRGFSFKLAERSTSRPKFYACDLGMMAALWSKPTVDVGARLETLVFHHFQQQGSEIYYFADAKHEVDFGVVEDRKVARLVQACASMEKESTRSREISALIAFGKKYDCRDLQIVTFHTRENLTIDGARIKIRPAHEFCDVFQVID